MSPRFPVVAVAALFAAPLCAAEPASKEVRIDVKLVSLPTGKLESLSKQNEHLAACCRTGQAELGDVDAFMVLDTVGGESGYKLFDMPCMTTRLGKRGDLAIKDVPLFVYDFPLLEYRGLIMVGALQPRIERFTTGLRLSVRPTLVGRDRVRLHFKIQQTVADPAPSLAPVITWMPAVPDDGTKADPVKTTQFIQQPALTTVSLERILVVPDGKTMLVRGWTATETICHRSRSILPFVWPVLGLPMDTSELIEPVIDEMTTWPIVGTAVAEAREALADVPLINDTVRYERQTKDVLLLITSTIVTDQAANN